MLAAIHAGALKPPAIDDLHDPEARKFWGVDDAATVAVPPAGDIERELFKFEFGGEAYEIYRHPHHFITEEITAFYNQRRWLERAGSAMEYGEANPKYHIAEGIYETFLAKFGGARG